MKIIMRQNSRNRLALVVLALSVLAATNLHSQQLRRDAENGQWRDVSASNLPIQIINEIKSTPKQDRISVTDTIAISSKIIRVSNLVFNPKGTLNWTFPDVVDDGNFIVIAAERLVINGPGVLADMPKLNLVPPTSLEKLAGLPGAPGATGWSSGSDDGQSAGRGNTGATGGNGKTYTYPNVFFIYQDVVINVANPSIRRGCV